MIRVAILFLLCVAVAQPAAADPRWWWHDRAISTGSDPKAAPDLTVVAVNASGGMPPILVAYEQRASSGIDVLLDASFDGGCTFCGAIPWASAIEDETHPRVAAGILGGNRLAMQVIYQKSGEVFVSSDATLTLSGGADVLCQAFRLLRAPAPRQLSQAPESPAGGPRIVAQPRGNFVHFHALWTSGSALVYEHDLVGDGTGWGSGGYENVTLTTSEFGLGQDLTADVLAATSTDTAVTLFYTDFNLGEVRILRSTDSGNSWAGPGSVVSGMAKRAAVSADTSGLPFSATAWNGCAWQPASAPGNLALDAAQWTAPTTRSPDFDPTLLDVPVSDSPDTPGSNASLALGPGTGLIGSALPLYVHWTREQLPSEIVARGGVLDSAALAQPRDVTRAPYAARRTAPPDPSVSSVEPFSNCLWDDGWPAMTAGACAFQARAAGEGARSVASADSLGGALGLPADFFTVFADNRGGVSQIYFKRTDGRNEASAITRIGASCAGLRAPAVDLEFALRRECPAAPERIDRYLLYYGSQESEGAGPDGPFASRLVVDNVGLSDPQGVTLSGLRPGETYHFALLSEDEARNLSPADFDPRTRVNTLAAGQVRTVRLPACEPVLALACAPGPDSCAGLPPDGSYNPGDTVPFTLTFSNSGDFAASSVQGTLAAIGATITQPPGGVVTIASIAAAGSASVSAEIVLDPTCPPPDPELGATGLSSDAGQMSYPDLACSAPLLPVDCASTCGTDCLVATLSPVRPLLGARAGRDIAWAWPGSIPAPNEYHVNSAPAPKTVIPSLRRPPVGVGQARCDVPGFSCSIAGAVDDPQPLVFHQVFAACGATGDQEGP